MRLFLILFFCFFSSLAFSAGTWEGRSAFSTYTGALNSCNKYPDPTNQFPVLPYKVDPYVDQYGNKYRCYVNPSPCDDPEIWDQAKFQCRIPCVSGQTEVRQFSPVVNVVCVSGCAVNQSSDSSCTGTAAEGGTCTAEFTTTGAFCPSAGEDNSTSPPNTGGGSTGGGSTGGGSTGGGDTGGGDTGGGSTGGGDTGGGSTGGSSSSSGNTGGGSGGSNSSGSGSGSVTGGGDCDKAPVCADGVDSASCAQVTQLWRLRCAKTELDFKGDGQYEPSDHDLNIGDRLQQQKDKYNDRVAEIIGDLQSSLQLSVSGGGSLMCNPQTIFGQSIDLSICARMDFLNLIQGLFIAVAVVLSVYIILSPRG